MNNDLSDNLLTQIAEAATRKTTLVITGGDTKAFYGNRVEGETISTSGHTGIIEYQPSELVVTVRSGTLLSELEAELKANKQMLAFEPPQHGESSTIGGAIACGLSGPGRATYGSARDFVLGTSIINGKAEKLKFGGQVMKNVAGYDASRLMVGAQGTLGVILDISLKVLPVVEAEITLKTAVALNDAVDLLRQWIKQGLAITASCYLKDTLYLRLGSTASAVRQALDTINKQFDTEEIDADFWTTVKNQTHDFFSAEQSTSDTLWRCSHQCATEFYGDTENQMIEWNGALRWVYSSENLHAIAAGYGGHATRYPVNSSTRDIDGGTADIFQPLKPELFKIHRRLKQAFDPDDLLNPGRLYAGL